MTYSQKIDLFLLQARSRLNRLRFLDCLIGSLAVTAGLLSILGLIYILQGHAVPGFWYGMALVALPLAALFLWCFRYWTKGKAARFADEFFQLKDSLATSLAFRNTQQPDELRFIQLQEKTTACQIDRLDPRTIRYHWPKRTAAVALILALSSGVMAFREASPAVLEQQRIEAATAERTREINEMFEELVDELEKEAGAEENSALDTGELRELVENLEEMTDQKAAMRQYAQLERKLNEAASRLDQRKNEELLSKAGEELQRDAENRQLGEKLEQKNYREAAEDLEAMQPSEMNPASLGEAEKELAKLKAVAQRLAAAANAADQEAGSRNSQGRQPKDTASLNENAAPLPGEPSEQGEPSTSPDEQQDTSNDSESSPQETSPNMQAQGADTPAGQNAQQSLGDQMRALEEAVAELEDALANSQDESGTPQQAGQPGQAQDQGQQGQQGQDANPSGQVASALGQLAQSLRQSDAQRRAQAALQALSEQAGQAQQLAAAPANAPSPGAGQQGAPTGNPQAGSGSVDSRRDQRDPLIDNGNVTQIEGTKGSGPSQTKVETATDGSGVSSRRSVERTREFSQQVESFVQREDVPEDVKRGVKEYFENMHQGE